MSDFEVTIEGSGRHMHVTNEHLAILFGEGYELPVKKMLSQPGQYLADAKVDVVGPKGTIPKVSIIGPVRKATQVEVSFTDARVLGLTPPIRESGDVKESGAVTLVGPAGSVELKEGVIIAKRHVHLTPEDAAKIGVGDGEIVQVKVCGPRALIFDEVVSRISPSYATSMHIDYDEMNGAALFGDAKGVVIKK